MLKLIAVAGFSLAFLTHSMGENLNMMPGTVRVFKSDTAFETIVVGDPEIADVSVYSDRDFSVTGKKEGVTTIVTLTKTKSVAGEFSISVHPSVIVYRNSQQFQLYNCQVGGACFPAKGSISQLSAIGK